MATLQGALVKAKLATDAQIKRVQAEAKRAEWEAEAKRAREKRWSAALAEVGEGAKAAIMWLRKHRPQVATLDMIEKFVEVRQEATATALRVGDAKVGELIYATEVLNNPEFLKFQAELFLAALAVQAEKAQAEVDRG